MPEPYLRFVVHFHPTTHAHYDLRIELGGALYDLVLPKGPSTDPSVARVAIQWNDHTLSFLKFEGRVRHEEVRSVPLLMWDRGIYAPCCHPEATHEEAIWAGLDAGYLELEFFGHKMKGKWRMVRTGERWTFQKMPDAHASAKDILLQNRSVLSGKTIDEL